MASNDAEFTIRVTGAAPPPLPPSSSAAKKGSKKGGGRGRGKAAKTKNNPTQTQQQQRRYNMRLRPSSSLVQFRKDVFALFNVASCSVDSYQLSFLGGFPPKELNSEGKNTVQDLGIRPNESLIVKFALSGDAKQSSTASSADGGDRKDPPERITAAAAVSNTGCQKRASAMAATANFAEIIAAQDAILKKESNKKSTSSAGKSKIGGFGNTKKRIATISAPAAGGGRKAKNAKMEGNGYRLSDGKSYADPSSKKKVVQQQIFKSKDDIANTLLNGKGGNAGKVVRAAMKGALAKSYEATRAAVRVTAVNTGDYTFEKVKGGSVVDGGGVVLGIAADHGPQTDGDADEDSDSLGRTLYTVSYSKGMEGRGRFEEQVEIIGSAAVKAVLESVYNTASSNDPDGDDGEESANGDKDGRLRPVLISQLSPITFWSLVYHCSRAVQNPTASSVEDMLRSTMPKLDWSHLDRGGRKRVLSEKAKDNLRQKRAGTTQSTSQQSSVDDEEAELRALKEMEDSIVEVAMSSEGGGQALNERERRRRAALSRFDKDENDTTASPPARPKDDLVDDWKLVTPEDDDTDELIECIMEGTLSSEGEDTTDENYDEDAAKAWAGVLLDTIRNWRELANSNPERVLSILSGNNPPSSATIERWIDAAQERTLEEIMVEILDGDQDALDALMHKARSSSPQSLIIWQYAPGMLVDAICPGSEKVWDKSDVLRWIGRAKTALSACNWLELHTTAVSPREATW